MARINNLTNFLTDVASAIKEKKGDNTNIPAEEFDIEILALSGGGNYQTKTLNITSNGTQIVTPDQDYDAIEQLTITTNVPIASLQSKSYTFTTNQTMTLSPDTGYDGFSSVEVTVNVAGGGEGIQEYVSVQAMEEAGLDDGEKAVVYNSTDKLVGYYNGAFATGVRMVPAESVTYDDVNHTATISQANSTVIGDEISIKNLLAEICTAYNWIGPFIRAKLVSVFRLDDKWYAGVFKLSNGGTPYVVNPDYDGTNMAVAGYNTSVTGNFEYCELNLSDYTYGEKLVSPCSTIDYPTTSSTAREIIGLTSQVLPLRYTNSSLDYSNIMRGYSATTVGTTYTKNGDTTVVGSVSSINLLDNGLIYGSSDANATANDILLNKTAYVNGVKLVGTYEGSSGGSGDVKLFTTEQAMQNDPNPSEGDLAVVYRNEIQPIQSDVEYNKFIFPDTIDLGEEMNVSKNGEGVSLGFMWCDDENYTFEARASDNVANNDYAIISWHITDNKTMVRQFSIEYTTSDGIHFIKTNCSDTYQWINEQGELDGYEDKTDIINEVELPVEIYYSMPQEYREDPEIQAMYNGTGYTGWMHIIGSFFQTENAQFNGLYQYKNGQYQIAPSQLTLNDPNQLPSGISGYGAIGVITGVSQEDISL